MPLDISAIIYIALILAVFGLYVLYSRKCQKIDDLELRLEELASRKQSLSTKYGKMSEQFMPFIEKYPYDEHNFRFIGSPIDGIQFEDDKIVFVEFKTSNSVLTKKQKNIRGLINKGKIMFKEFRI